VSHFFLPRGCLTVKVQSQLTTLSNSLSMYYEYCYDEEASDDGSTEYSEYCDDDTIRAAAQVTELISSAPSSTALGKRKSPDESGAFDDPSPINYKRRAISSFDSVTASSEGTLFDPLDTSLASDDIPTSQPEYDGPEPYIIVRPPICPKHLRAYLPLDSGIQRKCSTGYGCPWHPLGNTVGDCPTGHLGILLLEGRFNVGARLPSERGPIHFESRFRVTLVLTRSCDSTQRSYRALR
jgi:hypothetical protein